MKEEDGKASPVKLLSPDECFTVDTHGEVTSYRFVAEQEGLPAHLECSIGEQSLDQDDGPNLPAMTSRQEWSGYVGSYYVNQWGQRALTVAVSERQGHLYLNETRLMLEVQPGLFVTVDGEIVDFRRSIATWKNLELIRER